MELSGSGHSWKSRYIDVNCRTYKLARIAQKVKIFVVTLHVRGCFEMINVRGLASGILPAENG